MRLQVRPEKLYERQARRCQHDQVLQDDRGFESVRLLDRLGRIGAKMKDDVLLRGQHAPNGFADDGLVVHEKNRDLVLRQCSVDGSGSGRFRCGHRVFLARGTTLLRR